MTGFGKATIQLPTKKITVEVKSLNSKGLDLNVNAFSLPRNGIGLRTQIASTLERGSGFFYFIESTAEQTTTKVNVPIVKAINQLKRHLCRCGPNRIDEMAVRMPDAMKIERDEIDENDWAQIKVVIEEGLNNIMTFRKDEGVSLEKNFNCVLEIFDST
jgi:uncharacterized protein YicC (UPF0701 family)